MAADSAPSPAQANAAIGRWHGFTEKATSATRRHARLRREYMKPTLILARRMFIARREVAASVASDSHGYHHIMQLHRVRWADAASFAFPT